MEPPSGQHAEGRANRSLNGLLYADQTIGALEASLPDPAPEPTLEPEPAPGPVPEATSDAEPGLEMHVRAGELPPDARTRPSMPAIADCGPVEVVLSNRTTRQFAFDHRVGHQ